MVVARDWEGENWESMFKGDRVSVLQGEKDFCRQMVVMVVQYEHT